jgi:membrane-associated phospholipid phosphatase
MMNNSWSTTWAQLGERIRSELKLKLVLTIALNLWFYVPYGLLQQHHFFQPTQILPTFLDRLIPFSDEAVWVYLSIFLLMPIGPLLMSRRQQLLRYAMGILLIETVGYLVFIFWPTWCQRPNANEAVNAYRILTMVDAPLNAFPSLHAAFALFSALCAVQVFREFPTHHLYRIAVGLWTVLILLGTLVTKQHTVVDVIAGSALGFIAYHLAFGEWMLLSKRNCRSTQSINVKSDPVQLPYES